MLNEIMSWIGCCGCKESGSDDLFVMHLPENTCVAGVFTRSRTAASNIDRFREILSHGVARVIILNSGNANCFNGSAGNEAIVSVTNRCVKLFDCAPEEVYFISTGIIGHELPLNNILNQIEVSKNELCPVNWDLVSKVMMTTDTYNKVAKHTVKIADVDIQIVGIAKGAGMVCPDMATTLCNVFTDANINNDILQDILNKSIEHSFNCITIDGDTSTNDSILAFATKTAKNPVVHSMNDLYIQDFVIAFRELLTEMAHMVVRDAEGTTKFISVTVRGAGDNASAKKIAKSVANSVLVKAAMYGCDPNWGRVAAAVGKANERVNKHKMAIKIGKVEFIKNNKLNLNIDYKKLAEYMSGPEIKIDVDVANEDSYGEATVWTSDLSDEYIKINSEFSS